MRPAKMPPAQLLEHQPSWTVSSAAGWSNENDEAEVAGASFTCAFLARWSCGEDTIVKPPSLGGGAPFPGEVSTFRAAWAEGAAITATINTDTPMGTTRGANEKRFIDSPFFQEPRRPTPRTEF